MQRNIPRGNLHVLYIIRLRTGAMRAKRTRALQYRHKNIKFIYGIWAISSVLGEIAKLKESDSFDVVELSLLARLFVKDAGRIINV
jgi:hypothetical protein